MSRWVKANPEQWFWHLGAPQLMLCGSSWVRRGQLSPGTARGKVWNVEMKERGQMREVCVALGSEPPPALGKLVPSFGRCCWRLNSEESLDSHG